MLILKLIEESSIEKILDHIKEKENSVKHFRETIYPILSPLITEFSTQTASNNRKIIIKKKKYNRNSSSVDYTSSKEENELELDLKSNKKNDQFIINNECKTINSLKMEELNFKKSKC